MYEFIRGEVSELTPACAVIETSAGVGYLLNISLQTYSSLKNGEQALLYVHFIVREDAQILYGFHGKSERELFRLLIGVSGVGGNTARMILSTFTPEELKSVIATGKAEVLKGVKGLGIKTAQKIIVELKDKVIGVDTGEPAPSVLPGDQRMEEALAAMAMLGFPKSSAEKVLSQIARENDSVSVEELIRLALKKI